MNNSDQTEKKNLTIPLIIFGVLVVATVAVLLFPKDNEQEVVVSEPIAEVVEVETLPEEVVPEEEVVIELDVIEEPVTVEIPEPLPNPLPPLNESDNWVQEKLPSLTWRQELLKLVINEDMIRRFVVFTDNFSQGIVAYEHSPLVSPTAKFSAIENKSDDNNIESTWAWNEESVKRFQLYVELLRSIDSDLLVQYYVEAKPLIDSAYAELGYADENFTETLQDAISKVLDMELPKEPVELIRPSVMYQYKNKDIESLDDAEKLMLRIGKDNLLVIKSILLEINEKIARQSN